MRKILLFISSLSFALLCCPENTYKCILYTVIFGLFLGILLIKICNFSLKNINKKIVIASFVTTIIFVSLIFSFRLSNVKTDYEILILVILSIISLYCLMYITVTSIELLLTAIKEIKTTSFNIKSNLKNIVKMLLITVLCSVVCFMMISFIHYLPKGNTNNNLKESAVTLNSEGDKRQLFSWCSSTLDNFTDSYILLISSTEKDSNIFDKAASNYYPMFNKSPTQKIYDIYVNNEQIDTYDTYSRYWHGYVLLIKPLLMFMNYSEIRTLNSVVLTLLILYAAYEIYKKDKKLLLVYIVYILMLMPLVIIKSLQFSPCFYISLVTTIIIVRKKRINTRYVFLFSGIATSFFDFLSFPLITFGIPISFLIMLEKDGNSKLKNIIKYLAVWLIGYFGMWSLKWVISSIVIGENVILNAIDTARIRSSDVADNNLLGIVGGGDLKCYYLTLPLSLIRRFLYCFLSSVIDLLVLLIITIDFVFIRRQFLILLLRYYQ